MGRNIRKILYYFGLFNDEDIEWFIEAGEKKAVKKGEILIPADSYIDNIFVVLDGRFLVYLEDERNTVITELDSGEILGEMSFIDKIPTSATVKATADSWVLAVKRSVLSEKLDSDKKFAANFYRAIAMYLSDRIRDNISVLGYGTHQQPASRVLSNKEINEIVLANLESAGKRFNQLIERLSAVR